MRVMGDLRTRFIARVEFRGWDDCWNWRGAMSEDGYGRFTVSPSKRARAHRFSYELFIGAIPGTLTIDHRCRNRACVNPAHLEPVTNRTNILRGRGVAALHAAKTHCINGHEFSPENTHWVGPDRRWRDCSQCRSDRRARRQAAA